MKKTAFTLVFFLLVSLACERPESLTTSLPELANQESISIADAKNYFIKTVLPSNPSGRVASQNKYERDIDWNSAKKVKQANGLEVVAAPVIYKTSSRPGVILWDDKTSDDEKRPKIENVLDAKECLLTYKDKSGNFQTQIVQYIPSKEYKTKKKGVIFDDFSGWVMALTWDEKLVAGYEFKNGKDIRQLTMTKAAAGGRLSSCDFTYYQSVTANCYSCGTNCTACDVSISGGYQGFCTGPSSNSATDPNTNVSYGGSQIYYYTAPSGIMSTKINQYVREIEINLTNPCLKVAVDNVFNATSGGTEILGEQIGQMMLNLLPNTTRKKIFIEQEANNDRNLDGRYLAGGNNGILYLNTNALGNASEEYIAATLIHELVHGYYHEINGRSLGNDADHINMSLYYVQPMAYALVNMYGMSQQNAEAIAWGGLQDTPQWTAKSSSEKNNIAIVNGNYKSGVSGRKNCR